MTLATCKLADKASRFRVQRADSWLLWLRLSALLHNYADTKPWQGEELAAGHIIVTRGTSNQGSTLTLSALTLAAQRWPLQFAGVLLVQNLSL